MRLLRFTDLETTVAGVLPEGLIATAMALDVDDNFQIVGNTDTEAFAGDPAGGFAVVPPPADTAMLQLTDVAYSAHCERFVAVGSAQRGGEEVAVVVTIDP